MMIIMNSKDHHGVTDLTRNVAIESDSQVIPEGDSLEMLLNSRISFQISKLWIYEIGQWCQVSKRIGNDKWPS